MGDKKTKVVLDADVINHFSRAGRLSLLPNILPEFQFIVLDIVKKELPMLILTDRENCAGHSPDLAAQQLFDAVTRLRCESVLLDFQRPPNPELEVMATTIQQALPCPVAVTERYAVKLDCPVFLSPCPLHIPLEDYLRPWNHREIWLEAALCQETITVTAESTHFVPVYPTQPLTGGFYNRKLHCRYQTAVYYDRITFTLFDTTETLEEKLEAARNLGVSRAVGLYQELSYLG